MRKPLQYLPRRLFDVDAVLSYYRGCSQSEGRSGVSTREFYTTRTSTNHDLNREPCLHDLLAAVPHEFSGVIRAFGTPAKNDMNVGIAL